MAHNPKSQNDQGMALILALLVLVLIMAIGIALVFLAGGESSITGNQRSYALDWNSAVGGLQEARGRLSVPDPSYIGNTAGFGTAGISPLSFPANVGDDLYILNNPGGTPAVTDVTNSTSSYYDWEYDKEWGSGQLAAAVTAGKVKSLTSDAVSASVSTLIPQIPYKWVRVTILTEKAANRDINNDGTLDNTIPVYYDGATNLQNISSANPRPGGIVYRLTSMALLSNGTQSMVQEDVGPGTPVPAMPGALTLCGSNVMWNPPHSNNWNFNGNDMGNPPQSSIDGIATCNAASATTIQTNLPKPNNYKGKGGTGASGIANDSGTMDPCLQSVTCLNNMVASLAAEANVLCVGPCNPATPMGTTASPQITVIEDSYSPSFSAGSTSSCSGAGILVVTGTLTCAGGSTFSGIIMVVGQGVWNISGGGSGAFEGEFFEAQTKDTSGNPLATPGTVTFNESGGGANSMTFDSSLINQMNNMFSWKVLNFREISQ